MPPCRSARMRHPAMLCLLLLGVGASPLRADAPSTLEAARAAYAQALAAFAALEYDRSLALFADVEGFLDAHPRDAAFFDHRHRGFSFVDVVAAHRKLPTRRPLFVHTMLSVFVDRTDAVLADGRAIHARFEKERRDAAILAQDVCARLVEVLTDGRLGLRFVRAEVDASVTDVFPIASSHDEAGARETLHARVESITPFPSDLMMRSFEDVDSFLIYWGDGKVRSASGAYPTAMGTLQRIPVLPYQLDGPRRGRIVISSSLADRPGTLLHELFHVFEKVYRISPIHGFWREHRSQFPDWPKRAEGTEFDYYAWQLGRVTAREALGRTDLSTSSPSAITDRVRKANEKALASLEPGAAERASALARRAVEFGWSRPEAGGLVLEALERNPSSVAALLAETQRCHQQKRFAEALVVVERAYALDPGDPELLYWLGVEHHNLGHVEDGIAWMTKALALDGAMGKAWIYRGAARLGRKQHELAAADYARAIELDPSHADAILGAMRRRADAGDVDARHCLEALARQQRNAARPGQPAPR